MYMFIYFVIRAGQSMSQLQYAARYLPPSDSIPQPHFPELAPAPGSTFCSDATSSFSDGFYGKSLGSLFVIVCCSRDVCTCRLLQIT